MADRIKGITIEFRGNSTPLQKAIREVDSELKKTTKELSSVNKALKFNPTNVDLWRQKQQLLTQKVSETTTKLDSLKQAQKQLDASGVDKNTEDYRKLQRQIIETESQLKTFKGQLREVGNANLKALSEQFKAAGTSIESAGQSMRGLSIAAAGVATGIGAIAVKAGMAADDLNTMSKVTGIGTDQLQKYGYAADLVDVSTEAIAKAQRKLTKQMYEVGVYAQGPAEEFEWLGVAVTDANGKLRDSEVVFQEVLASLGEMTNETERDAIAQTLMGKSAAELNPLIEDGGETYKKVAETMQKYGLEYVDQATLDRANQFNDSLDTTKLLGSVAFAQIGTELAAFLAPALEKAVDLVGQFAKWLSDLSPETLTVIATIAGFVAILAPLLIGIGKVAFAISSIINVISLASGAFAGIGALLTGPVVIALGAVVVAIAAVIGIMKIWKKHGDSIKQFFGEFGQRIKNIWNDIKEAIVKAANSIYDSLTWPFRKAWDIIESVVDKIKSWFPIDIGNFFGDIELPHFSWEWMDLGGVISIPKISVDWYDKGGIFDSPTVIGVGEKRPEFVGALDDLRKIVREESGSGSAAPIINIYPTPYQSPREIALEVQRELVALNKQENRAYGTI